MNSDGARAQAFVGRLLQNPALRGLTVLQREEHIHQFLRSNAPQLGPTLASNQFFPGKNWQQIVSLLYAALHEATDKHLVPDIDRMVREQIAFTFVHLLHERRVDTAKLVAQVSALIQKLLSRVEFRRAMVGPYTALRYNVIDRYLDEVFNRKKYVHFELTKVQRLRLGKDEIRQYVQLNILLKPTIAMITLPVQNQRQYQAGIVQHQFADKVLRLLKKELQPLPEPVLKSAVDANVSFNEHHFLEATARLSAIFSARARNYQPDLKVDRGADSPDKSWLNVARRNYKFYGFDVKMLDELYKIAAENMW